MKNKKMQLSSLALVLIGVSSTSANAAILITELNNDAEDFFAGNASATDLINISSSSLDSFVASTSGVGAGTSLTGAHDGSTLRPSGFAYWNTGGVPVTLTYTFDISTNTAGYDITSINTIYGWRDSRSRHAAQHYDVEITTIANATFTNLASVDYDPFNDQLSGSSQVTITDDAGSVATGVTGIRFTVRTDNGTEIGVINEFDVIGSATTVPEPSTSLLSMFGALSLALRRRRQ